MILRRVLAHYRLGKSLRPRLENIDFSSQILESCAIKRKEKTMKKLFDYLKTALQNISVGGVLACSDCVVFVALCAVIYALFLREIL